jgi:hypothetical protein
VTRGCVVGRSGGADDLWRSRHGRSFARSGKKRPRLFRGQTGPRTSAQWGWGSTGAQRKWHGPANRAIGFVHYIRDTAKYWSMARTLRPMKKAPRFWQGARLQLERAVARPCAERASSARKPEAEVPRMIATTQSMLAVFDLNHLLKGLAGAEPNEKASPGGIIPARLVGAPLRRSGARNRGAQQQRSAMRPTNERGPIRRLCTGRRDALTGPLSPPKRGTRGAPTIIHEPQFVYSVTDTSPVGIYLFANWAASRYRFA